MYGSEQSKSSSDYGYAGFKSGFLSGSTQHEAQSIPQGNFSPVKE